MHAPLRPRTHWGTYTDTNTHIQSHIGTNTLICAEKHTQNHFAHYWICIYEKASVWSIREHYIPHHAGSTAITFSNNGKIIELFNFFKRSHTTPTHARAGAHAHTVFVVFMMPCGINGGCYDACIVFFYVVCNFKSHDVCKSWGDCR